MGPSLSVRRAVILTVAVTLALLGVTTPAGAEADSRCTRGDARSLFETVEIANEIRLRSGLVNPRAETLTTCQWRFFWTDGHPLLGEITFSEEDVILGGVVLGIDYAFLGIPRREAVAELEGVEVRTWLAEVTNGQVGPLVEQPLMRSAIKNFVAHQEGLGPIAVQNWGFITQLPAGEYRSVTEVRHVDPDNHTWDSDWTVEFTVTPAGS